MASIDQPSVVLIDDNSEQLGRLQHALEAFTAEDNVAIRVWTPTDGDDPYEKFEEVVDENTLLVVTDYDLTKAGLTGLFGVSIVSWCQSRFIPAGDFSRGVHGSLPSESNLFELRVPTGIADAARYTATMYRGFRDLRGRLEDGSVDLSVTRSPAEVLAAAIGRPALESQIALYMTLLGAANASLLDSLRTDFSRGDEDAADSGKQLLLTYVVGHVLANAVMRYPGPILSEKALCAYVGTGESEGPAIRPLFSEAAYYGPFSDGITYYWRTDVDEIITRNSPSAGDSEFETSGEFNRAVTENLLGRELARHACPRCAGTNGGYLCPFTSRAVCERSDCSVAANSWIPLGADVCRVEREFYEEWAPMLGL
jgi:hypothetical protein